MKLSRKIINCLLQLETANKLYEPWLLIIINFSINLPQLVGYEQLIMDTMTHNEPFLVVLSCSFLFLCFSSVPF